MRWLLCHKAGLPYVDATLTLEEALAWDPMIRALEEQAPVWEPGTAHGYHATTYGWLVGEVVRRISGKSLGTFFHDEIAAPLDLEFWIGLPDEQQARVAPLIQWGDGTSPSGDRRSGDGRADRAVHGTRHDARQGARRPEQRVLRRRGRLQQPGDPRRGDPRRQRRHQRPFPRPLLRRAHRHRRRRAVRAAPHGGAGGQGLRAADLRPGQVPLLRDHLRPRVLRGVALRAVRRRSAPSGTPARVARWASPTPRTASASAT